MNHSCIKREALAPCHLIEFQHMHLLSDLVQRQRTCFGETELGHDLVLKTNKTLSMYNLDEVQILQSVTDTECVMITRCLNASPSPSGIWLASKQASQPDRQLNICAHFIPVRMWLRNLQISVQLHTLAREYCTVQAKWCTPARLNLESTQVWIIPVQVCKI